MTGELTYAAAGELLERFRLTWLRFDGDAWVALFTDDVMFHDDPFEAPLIGHNAVRAYLLQASDRQEQLDVTIERHWVAPPTILAAWHASYVLRTSRSRVQLAGFMTLEVAADGRIARLREWTHRRERPVE